MEKAEFKRISLSFHATFAPERIYIAKLMSYISVGNKGSLNDISNETGIPMGASSGKVEPTMKYAQGMGLINISKENGSGYLLTLTTLGTMVSEQDPFLKEELTQWLLHLMFCRCHGGAEAWYYLFGESRLRLGDSFSKEDLRKYLENCFGKRKDIVGPLLRMYANDSGFSLCGALSDKGGMISRKKAPLDPIFYYSYAYIMMDVWNQVFPSDQQLTIGAFEGGTRFFSALGWRDFEMNDFLDGLSDEGILRIDRQTGEALLLRMMSIEKIANRIYDNLI